MSSEVPEIPDNEVWAAQQLCDLIEQSKAEEVLTTYMFCKQSCDYVYGIVRDVAHDESFQVSDDVKDFARNLLDDWSK